MNLLSSQTTNTTGSWVAITDASMQLTAMGVFGGALVDIQFSSVGSDITAFELPEVKFFQPGFINVDFNSPFGYIRAILRKATASTSITLSLD